MLLWQQTPDQGIEQYSLLQNSNDVAALMDYLNIPQAVIIGHDWQVSARKSVVGTD